MLKESKQIAHVKDQNVMFDINYITILVILERKVPRRVILRHTELIFVFDKYDNNIFFHSHVTAETRGSKLAICQARMRLNF